MPNVFYIRPEPRGPQIEVTIWPLLRDMRQSARDAKCGKWRKAWAYTRIYAWPVEGIYAEIHLCAKKLQLEVIAHEAAHAALGLAQLRRFDEDLVTAFTDDGMRASANEERFADAVGTIVTRIVEGLGSES